MSESSRPAFPARNPDYEGDTRASFAGQGAMAHLGARLVSVTPGEVRIELPFRDEVSQQHGYFHGGIVATIADSAAGYAAFTLMAPGSAVLSVEYKINFLAPANGELLVATGRVRKPGRTLTISEFEVVVVRGGDGVPCAMGVATMMRLEAGGAAAR